MEKTCSESFVLPGKMVDNNIIQRLCPSLGVRFLSTQDSPQHTGKYFYLRVFPTPWISAPILVEEARDIFCFLQ